MPTEMMHMHLRALDQEMFKGRQVLVEMPAVAVTTQVVRLHSGRIQGLQLFHNLQGPGGGTPWVNGK